MNINEQGKTTSKIATKNIKYDIYSDDILNRRLFAWYDLFNSLCIMDMEWNSNTFSNVYSNVEQLYGDLSILYEIQEEMLPILIAATSSADDIIKNSKNTANSTSLLIEHLSKLLKARDPKFYESFLNRLEKIAPTINTLAVDQSLKQLKDDVFSILLPLMKERETGIYNNDFENVCKNLILVSAFRGNDILDSTKELSEYLTEKNNLYDIVKEIAGIHGNAKQALQQKHEIEEKLKEIINALRSKK